mgnify:CR=1 FL=1
MEHKHDSFLISTREAMDLTGLTSFPIWKMFKEIRESDQQTRRIRGHVNRQKFYDYIVYIPPTI